MIRTVPLVLGCLVLIAGGCRPKGEVVRYMARPPAVTRPAPQDGTYLLYPGVNKPPVLAEELKAGEPVGFAYEDTAYGRRIMAVAGDRTRIPLASGERYQWMLESGEADAPKTVAVANDRRLEIAERAFQQAEDDLKSAQANYDAAKRRLDEARAAVGQGK